jgi:hypothetical protein
MKDSALSYSIAFNFRTTLRTTDATGNSQPQHAALGAAAPLTLA